MFSSNSRSDPYAVVHAAGAQHWDPVASHSSEDRNASVRDVKLKTSTKKKCLDPVWNEILRFDLSEFYTDKATFEGSQTQSKNSKGGFVSPLFCQLHDEDMGGTDHFLGMVDLQDVYYDIASTAASTASDATNVSELLNASSDSAMTVTGPVGSTVEIQKIDFLDKESGNAVKSSQSAEVCALPKARRFIVKKTLVDKADGKLADKITGAIQLDVSFVPLLDAKYFPDASQYNLVSLE